MKAVTFLDVRGHQFPLGLGKDTEGVKRRPPGALPGARQSESAKLGDDPFGAGTGVDASLHGSERGADVGLEFVERCSERWEVVLGDSRKDSQEHQPAQSFGDAIGQGREIIEGLEFVRTMPAPGTGRLKNQDRPILRERQPGNQRRRMDLIAPAPSTISPPWRNPWSPIPDRRPRPESSASDSTDGSESPASLRMIRTTAKLSWVPTPRPTWSEGAVTTSIRAGATSSRSNACPARCSWM